MTWLSVGSSKDGILVLLLVGLLLGSSAGVALVQDPGPVSLDPVSSWSPEQPTVAGAPLSGVMEQNGFLPGNEAHLVRWLEWSEDAPLDLLEQSARDSAPLSGQRLIPSPDVFPGHDGASPEEQREAWRSWWLATQLAAMRHPSVPLDPLGAMPAQYKGLDGQGGGISTQEGGQSQPAGASTTSNPLGDPHGLERLWRLQTHGPPRMLLPAGDGEETYLVTDRGVLFIPSPGARPDWMLQLDGVAGHAEVATGDGGRKDLVVGMHSLYLDLAAPSIWVIDGEDEKVRFQGLSGDRALLYWGLTDVDGDGTDDILGVDASGNVTAVKLDGSEIYRKPVPHPDLPEEHVSLPDPLPTLPLLALMRTGAQLLGDATGDGTLDIFTVSHWGALGMQQLAIVSMVEGKTGTIGWSQPLDPSPGLFFRFTSPVLTGDLNGDGHDDVAIYDYSDNSRFVYLSGEDGRTLAREDPSPICCLSVPVTNDPVTTRVSMPLAFVDLEGDGEKKIISMSLGWVWHDGSGMYMEYDPEVQVRSLLPVEGGPTMAQQTYRIEFDQYWWWWFEAGSLQFEVFHENGKDALVLLIPSWATPPDEGTVLILVDDSGVEMVKPPQPVGAYTMNPQTGQRYAWTLRDDRWTPVDEQLRPTGNGTRLIMSNHPILMTDKDGDGTPDLLIPRSMGYFWISGRTGSIIGTVDRPITTALMGASASDDRHVLEADPDHWILYDAVEEKTVWTINRNVGSGAHMQELADFTGDGELEMLFRQYGGMMYSCDDAGVCSWEEQDDEWRVYSPELPGVVWEVQQGFGQAYAADLLEHRAGMEVLLTSHDGDDTTLRLFAPNSNTSEPAWSAKLDYIGHMRVEHGVIALQEYTDDGVALVVLEGATGKRLHTHLLDGEESFLWMRLVEAARGVHLVYSHTTGQSDQTRQSVTVIDIGRQEETTRFQISNPVVHQETFEYLGQSYSFEYVQPNPAGPVVGDWNKEGIPALALTEADWPVVRSLKDGSIIAMGPSRGHFTFTVDLNGDGQHEVGLNAGGSLRMYAYDPSLAQMEQEDPLSRVETVDPDEGDNETRTQFFDRDEKRSPAVAVPFVLLGLLAVVALKRSRRSGV